MDPLDAAVNHARRLIEYPPPNERNDFYYEETFQDPDEAKIPFYREKLAVWLAKATPLLDCSLQHKWNTLRIDVDPFADGQEVFEQAVRILTRLCLERGIVFRMELYEGRRSYYTEDYHMDGAYEKLKKCYYVRWNNPHERKYWTLLFDIKASRQQPPTVETK